MSMRLDISIGPVQGFVAQSRRSRDLWGSSYLLSFLSAHAMQGAQQARGRIVRPRVDDDPLYGWVAGQPDGADAPWIGSLPNHFVLEIDGDAQEAARVAKAALQSFTDAWEQVCTAVWEKFVAHAAQAGRGTAAIWKRQVNSFWEIVWTAAPADAPGLLARRKHWRTHRLPDEPGDKCTVMHDFQELSGYVRAMSQETRKKQDEFWARVRGRLGPLDLRKDERLCALALVKRLFPKVGNEALGWEVDTAHWPSTVYVAAVPWIRHVNDVAPQQASTYAGAVQRGAPPGVFHEWRSCFPNLDRPHAGLFAKLDANYFQAGFVEDERLCPLRGDAPDDTRVTLSRLLAEVCACQDESGREVGPPPVFYALLLADGDRLGQLVGTLGGERVGQALSKFTAAVPQIVKSHDGVTLYAGGDDVLAMLPVPGALSCADRLAETYAQTFAQVDQRAAATLSAAVVFAHVRLPLGAVINEAHRLLDDVAKESNGRDSLAACVMKRGGLHALWTTTWTRNGPQGNPAKAVESLLGLANRLGGDLGEPGLSSALIYRIRETLGRLFGWSRWVPGSWGAVPADLNLRAYLLAEVQRSLTQMSGTDADATAGELADIVHLLLGPSRRTQEGEDAGDGAREAGVDGLLLARFLARGGHEENNR